MHRVPSSFQRRAFGLRPFFRPLEHLVLPASALLVALAGATAQDDLVSTNVALNKPTAGDIAFGYPPSNGNDGSILTFTHADNLNPPPDNPFWELDLQGEFDITHLEIVDRADGCCSPNRLEGAEIRLFNAAMAPIGDPILVDGLSDPSSGEVLTFDNGGAGWIGVAFLRVDGFQQYFQFSELRAFSLQPALPPGPANAALFKPVFASAPLWPGLAAGSLTDGNPGSLSHPQADFGTLGFTWTIDLEEPFNLVSIIIRNRNNCCPERLTNYRVSVHPDDGSGQPADPSWTADIRTDGTNSGLAGEDILLPDLDPDGTMTGRFITIENLSDEPYNPQIAEVEALTNDPIPEPPTNFALGKPVTCRNDAGDVVATWGNFIPGSLTDGNKSTFSHPLDQFSPDFYYEIDLEDEVTIGTIDLTGRIDGCCPDRFTDATLVILNAGGNTVFTEVLSGEIIATRTVEIGNVTGRFIRIINSFGADYGPQVGEVEVFGATGPARLFQITELLADRVSGNVRLTWTSQPGATYSVFASPDAKTWVEINDSIPSEGESTSTEFTDSAVPDSPTRFYQVSRN